MRFRRRAIDLIGEDELGEERAGMKLKHLLGRMKDRHPDDVGRQQIAGELDALVIEPEHARQGLGQGRLAHARKILDEQMSARQQTGQRQTDLTWLAENDSFQNSDDLR